MPRMTLVHLDTDLGGDADDLCALAMLLGDAEVEITAVTTSADVTGQRAEFVRHALRLAGREDVPVAAGAAGFLGGIPHTLGNHDARYFPEFNFSSRNQRDPPGAAFDLLKASVAAGASVVAIGPYTNLTIFEAMRPAALAAVPVTVMGGWLGVFPEDYPRWGPNIDYNVQADRLAARIVFERVDPLIVPLRPCLDVGLRRMDLPALAQGGPLARLIALQGPFQCADSGFEELARANPALPADLLNFHWDPLACGVALGWGCFEVSELPLELVESADGSLAFEEQPGAKVRRVVTRVDVEGFRAMWLERVKSV